MRVSVSALLLGGLLCGGCAQNDQSVAIVGFAALESSACAASPTAPAGRAEGTLDIGAVRDGGFAGYYAAPVVQNLEPVSLAGTGTDVNAMFVKAFDIKITDSRVPGQYHSFRQPSAAGYLPSGGTNKLSAGVEIFPRQAALGLTGVSLTKGDLPTGVPIIVSIRPVVTQSSLEVVGEYVDFPIQICDGCIYASLGKCAVDPTTMMALRPGQLSSSQVVTSTTVVCERQQDVSSACCSTDTGPLCVP